MTGSSGVWGAVRVGAGLLLVATVATGCGRVAGFFSGGGDQAAAQVPAREERQESIFDLFRNTADPNVTVEVNRYLWNATLEIMDFLPVESADPFSGVIVYGFGTPPGGGRAYRATVLIRDPALDARSLSVALVTRGGGPASADTVRAVEDAILTRARQLRIADSRL